MLRPHPAWAEATSSHRADTSDYKTQQLAGDSFMRKYVAHNPPLMPDEPRQVFAPLLFPDFFRANAADPDPAPDGYYYQLFLKSTEYDDGFAKIVHASQAMADKGAFGITDPDVDQAVTYT